MVYIRKRSYMWVKWVVLCMLREHLTPGSPDFRKGASWVSSATSSVSSVLKSSVGRRWNESFGWTAKGSRVWILPVRFLVPLSFGGGPKSGSPTLYTTVLTDGSDKLSWPVMSVGGYCCRGEEKWRGRRIGQAWEGVVTDAALGSFSCSSRMIIYTFIFFLIIRTPLLHFCREFKAGGFTNPSQAGIGIALLRSLLSKFGMPEVG